MKNHQRKLIKYSKFNTIDFDESGPEEVYAWKSILSTLGYVRKVVEGSAEGQEMD
jgi:hypothetical protein